MSSSELSELTSNVSSDEENPVAPLNKGKLDHYFKNASNVTQAPPTLKKKRPPSPPHEYVLADNADIAVHIENGVSGSPPGEQVEKLLCALLSLVLNRKKDIEYACPAQARA
ncbi:MAG: hypothetical protein OHK93_002863 [Ramalina farinacea]|uniref:Uncharacterized protein n=1 Tax=Ramalina farinacea TaxID=258253 RepID=A0AA43TXM8_9LECA|nr:hypothetical protein [Ramalina farinacea]